MENNKKNKDLEALIHQKNFDELSEAEKAIVLDEMSRDEYIAWRNIILEGKEILDERTSNIEPHPDIQKNLQAALILKKEEKKKPFIIQMFNHKLPVYQLIAASVVFVIIIFHLQSRENSNETASIEYVYKTDTIFVEKTIIDTSTKENVLYSEAKTNQYKERKKPSLKESEFKENENPEDLNQYLGLANLEPDDIDSDKQKGRSLKDDSLLIGFYVSSF